MTKEQAVRIIIDYAAELPAKEALACHMAATDVQEYGVEEWVEWNPIFIIDMFVGIMGESSENSIDKVEAYTIGESLIDELWDEGYFSLENEQQDRIDYVETMKNMRESMMEGFDAIKAYFQVQEIIKIKYYGLY
ncbi:MAG: hypothetical protein Unbinned4409contig1001_54 [Prokaryotic dsDNA virus sp.]|nr:MAG: hypothetical protein Unbinned4409contig1001_54 [Prokaryotic dsDNA virus sp.]|tara:strand:+ start:1794 stop:2198 length:405 start_codon:yes stop_codon:yes gene_type:complete